MLVDRIEKSKIQFPSGVKGNPSSLSGSSVIFPVNLILGWLLP